ncbi:MAG: hypothetical protein ACRDRH_28820 [Pseudonocardia sp.]
MQAFAAVEVMVQDAAGGLGHGFCAAVAASPIGFGELGGGGAAPQLVGDRGGTAALPTLVRGREHVVPAWSRLWRVWACVWAMSLSR